MTLQSFFRAHPKVALAFSGGVDSAYLLYAAMQNGAQVRAYYVKSAFQPQFELEDARRLAEELGARLEILTADVLSDPRVAANPPDRPGKADQHRGCGSPAGQRRIGHPSALHQRPICRTAVC